MTDWKWNKGGKGCAGEYKKDDWTIWCNGSGWVITRPDEFTYAKEFKHVAYAKKFAEGKMKG
jgi:hypothetical protein